MLEIEGELEFDFSGSVSASRLDRQGVQLPQGMKLVDFFVVEQQRALLVEVKDPSSAGAGAAQREAYLKRLQTGDLLDELVPKARDSYTYIHLMKEDDILPTFVVVFGLERLPLDAALLLALRERLLKRMRCETDRPWQRKYVEDCVIVTAESWNQHFPYPLRRLNPAG